MRNPINGHQLVPQAQVGDILFPRVHKAKGAQSVLQADHNDLSVGGEASWVHRGRGAVVEFSGMNPNHDWLRSSIMGLCGEDVEVQTILIRVVGRGYRELGGLRTGWWHLDGLPDAGPWCYWSRRSEPQVGHRRVSKRDSKPRGHVDVVVEDGLGALEDARGCVDCEALGWSGHAVAISGRRGGALPS